MTDEMMTETVERKDSDLAAGELIAGRFEIVRKLAEGGMGKVYVAVQLPIGRQVALKVLRRELATDEAAVKRFFREAVAASKLHHPNTITIIDYGEGEGNTLFIAMELLDGESLHELLERESSLPLHRAVNITAQIARSLSEAHKKGVIHRDLKPENIFISSVEGETDLVKVLDFGIAKLLLGDATTRITRAGYVCGTPEYMSPEQARGEELNGTSDLYALGILLWEMLAGSVPYEAPTPLGTVLKHQNEAIPPMPGDAPDTVKMFVRSALAKSRAERPQTADEFMDALARAIPADYHEDPSMGRITGPRRVLAPSTPMQPLRQTGSLAMATTMAGDDLAAVPAEAPPRPGRSTALLVIAVAGVLAGLAGLAVIGFLLLNQKPAPASEPLAAPQPQIAPTEVEIAATPRADVYRGDKFLGQTPWTTRGEPGVKDRFTVRREGFKPAAVDFAYPETGRSVHEVTLEKTVPATFQVQLVSEPAGAMIVKDGRSVGSAPHAFDLEESDAAFDVELRLAGFESQTLTVDPAKGAQSMMVGLTPQARTPPPAPSRRIKKGASPAEPAEAKAPAKEPAAKAKVDPPPKKDPPAKKYRTVD